MKPRTTLISIVFVVCLIFSATSSTARLYKKPSLDLRDLEPAPRTKIQLEHSERMKISPIVELVKPTNQIELISKNMQGDIGNDASIDPVISNDGRHVMFISEALDLVSSLSSPGVRGVYSFDRQTGNMRRLTMHTGTNNSQLSPCRCFVGNANEVEVTFISEHPSIMSLRGAKADVDQSVKIIESDIAGPSIALDQAATHNCGHVAYQSATLASSHANPGEGSRQNIFVIPLTCAGSNAPMQQANTDPIRVTNDDGGIFGYNAGVMGNNELALSDYLLPEEYCRKVDETPLAPFCANYRYKDINISVAENPKIVVFPAIKLSTESLVLMVGRYDGTYDSMEISIPGGLVGRGAMSPVLSGNGEYLSFVYENVNGINHVLRCRLTVSSTSASCTTPQLVAQGDQPSISYDGDRIAYVNINGFIKVQDLDDNTFKFVGKGDNPTLNQDWRTAPSERDGDFVVFERDDQVYLKELDW